MKLFETFCVLTKENREKTKKAIRKIVFLPSFGVPVTKSGRSRGLLPFWYLFSEQGTGHPLVKQHGQHGNHCALDKIQGGYAQHDKGGNTVNSVMDSRTHGDNGVQGKTEQLGEFGQQIDGIEGTAEDRHG